MWRGEKREYSGRLANRRLGRAFPSLLVGLDGLNHRHPACNGAEVGAEGAHAAGQWAALLALLSTKIPQSGGRPSAGLNPGTRPERCLGLWSRRASVLE